MTTNRFGVFWSWAPREETAEQVYGRMAKSVDALKHINPAFQSWKVMDFAGGIMGLLGGGKKAIDTSTRKPVSEPAPPKGFMVLAANDFSAWPEGMAMLCAGAGRRTLPGMCGTTFQTAVTDMPDPSIVSYPGLRAILLALVPIWEASYAQVYSSALTEALRGGDGFFRASWMTYLSPVLAEKITPPANVAIEDTSDYGIVLSTTQNLFDAENPSHLAAAKDLLSSLTALGRGSQ
jgi:hypothetical protein